MNRVRLFALRILSESTSITWRLSDLEKEVAAKLSANEDAPIPQQTPKQRELQSNEKLDLQLLLRELARDKIIRDAEFVEFSIIPDKRDLLNEKRRQEE